MMEDRLTGITAELFTLIGELQSITARALPLVKELQDLGVELPPEFTAMLASIKPRPQHVH
jgi:hypothetical protein